MKRLLVAALVLSLGLFTLGCGGEKKAEKKPGTGPAAPSAPGPVKPPEKGGAPTTPAAPAK